MTESIATLEMDVDYGGGIGQKTLKFEMGIGEEGRASVDDFIQTGYPISGALDDSISFVSSLLDSSEELRKGIDFDPGGGVHTIELKWQSPGGSQKPGGGGYYQWGSSASETDGPNAHTATGADPYEQQAVFINAFRQGTTDSFTPATLSIGEYSTTGILDPLDVVVESPRTHYGTENPSKFDGSVVLRETRDLSGALDALDNDEK